MKRVETGVYLDGSRQRDTDEVGISQLGGCCPVREVHDQLDNVDLRPTQDLYRVKLLELDGACILPLEPIQLLVTPPEYVLMKVMA